MFDMRLSPSVLMSIYVGAVISPSLVHKVDHAVRFILDEEAGKLTGEPALRVCRVLIVPQLIAQSKKFDPEEAPMKDTLVALKKQMDSGKNENVLHYQLRMNAWMKAHTMSLGHMILIRRPSLAEIKRTIRSEIGKFASGGARM